MDPGGADDLPLMALPVIEAKPLDGLVPDLRGETRVAQVAAVAVRLTDKPEDAPSPDRAG